jgi:hypothetical protein
VESHTNSGTQEAEFILGVAKANTVVGVSPETSLLLLLLLLLHCRHRLLASDAHTTNALSLTPRLV